MDSPADLADLFPRPVRLDQELFGPRKPLAASTLVLASTQLYVTLCWQQSLSNHGVQRRATQTYAPTSSVQQPPGVQRFHSSPS